MGFEHRVDFPGKISAAALVAAILLFFLAGNFVYPYFEDTALYAAIARRILHGATLYRDVFDHKTPGIFLLESIRLALLGYSSLSARLFETAGVVLLAGLAVFALEHPISKGELLLKCAVLASSLGLFYSGVFWGLPERGQVEIYQAIFISASFCCYVLSERKENIIYPVAVGFCIGWVMWLKPTFLPAIFIYLLAYLWRDRNGGRAWLCYLAGVSITSIFMLLFLFICGDIHGFVWLLTAHHEAYLHSVNSTNLETLGRLLDFLSLAPAYKYAGFIVVLCLISILFGYRNSRFLRQNLIAFLLFLTAIYAYMLSGYGFYYHSIPIVCSVFILIFSVLAGGEVEGGVRFHKGFGVVTLLIIGAAALGSDKFSSEQRMAISMMVGGSSLNEAYHVMGTEMHYYRYDDEEEAARYLNVRYGNQYKFYILGLGAVTYLEANGENASRHLVTIFGQMPTYSLAEPIMSEIRDDLAKEMPQAILVRINDQFPWFGVPASSYDRMLSDSLLSSWVKKNYYLRGKLNSSFIAYERKPIGTKP